MRARFALLLTVATLFAAIFPVHEAIFDKGKALLYRDLTVTFLPAKSIWREGIVRDGEVPRWNHYSLAGVPFYADCNLAPLYPLNFVFLLFSRADLPYAMAWFLALHYGLLYLGGYFLLRTLRLPARFALWLGFGFAWNGFALSSYNLLNMLGAQVATLFFLSFWLRHLRRTRALDLCAAGLALALPIYAGDPQFTYILAFVAAFLLWLHHGKWRSYFALGGLTVLIAAAQLLPTLDFALASARGLTRLSEANQVVWSLHPWRILDFFFPVFMGGLAPEASYWAGNLVNSPFNLPFIHAMYCGGSALFLLGLTWFLRHRQRGVRARALAWTFAFFLTLVLALGSFSPLPLYKWFAQGVPLWGGFRYPERLGFWLVLLLLLLQARAYRRLFLWLRFSRDRRGGPARLAFALFPVMLCVALAFSALVAAPFPAAQLGHGSLVALASAALLACGIWRFVSPRLVGAALALLYVVDFATLVPNLVWTQSRTLAAPESYPATEKLLMDLRIREEALRAGGARRLLSSRAWDSGWDRARVHGILDEASALTLEIWEGISGSTSAYFQIDSLNSSLTMLPLDVARLWVEARKTDAQKAIDLFSLSYILAREPGKAPVVQRNASALPYVFVSHGVEFTHTRETAAQRVLAPRFSLADTVVIETPIQDLPDIPPAANGAVGVTIISRGGGSLVLRLQPTDDSVGRHLIWNTNFHPAWRAYIERDGKLEALGLRRANAWAIAAALPPLKRGQEVVVRFAYEDPLIRIGKLLTLLGMGLALFLIVRERRKTSFNAS